MSKTTAIAPAKPTRVKSTAAGQTNGAGTPSRTDIGAANDHLAKANKAMERAWKLIAQRQGDGA